MSAGDLVNTIAGALARGAVPLLMFALGLSATRFELGYLFARPRLLWRSLLATLVLAPLLLVGFTRLISLEPAVEAGLIVLAIAPGALFLPTRSLKLGGNDTYAYSLFLTLALLSLIVAPVSLWVLGRLSGHGWTVAPGALFPTLLVHQTLPVLLGLGVQRSAPHVAQRLFPPLRVLANTSVALIVAVVFVARGRALLHLDWLVLTVLFVVLSGLVLLAGHLLGGPDRGSRRTLAVFGAIRQPALALLIAHANLPSLNVAPTILSFLSASAFASFLYSRLAPRGVGRARPSLPLRLDEITASRA